MIMKQIIVLAMPALMVVVGTATMVTIHPQLVVACTTGNC
jgi:hypothetical protein